MRQDLVRTRAKGSQPGEELLETICVGVVQRPKEMRHRCQGERVLFSSALRRSSSSLAEVFSLIASLCSGFPSTVRKSLG